MNVNPDTTRDIQTVFGWSLDHNVERHNRQRSYKAKKKAIPSMSMRRDHIVKVGDQILSSFCNPATQQREQMTLGNLLMLRRHMARTSLPGIGESYRKRCPCWTFDLG